jgi:hypothetical protein
LALATVLFRKISVITPIKQEVICLVAPNSGDTVKTGLVRALGLQLTATENSGILPPPSAVINADGKTITLGIWDGATDLTLTVYGF